MHPTIRRDRLLAALRGRHQLSVVALESAPGFGRSVLLHQALQDGPAVVGDIDLFYRCGPDDHQPGKLAAEILRLCGPGESGSGTDAQRIIDSLVSVGAPSAQVALFLDDVERSADTGSELIRALVDRLPDRCHLVLSGRHLPRFGLARLIANGSASLIGNSDLEFNAAELSELASTDLSRIFPDPELARWPALASLMLQGHGELVVDFVNETVVPSLDPQVVKSIAVVSAIGGAPTPLIETILHAVLKTVEDDEHVADAKTLASDVLALPLVGSQDGCWPHPVWEAATGDRLTLFERDTAILAKIKGLIDTESTHDAGREAMERGSSVGLAAVLRAAFSTQPARASVADLRSWAASGLFGPDSVEQRWLDAIIDLQSGDVDGFAVDELQRVRQHFESVKDDEAEVNVLQQLGTVARAKSDTEALGALLQRGAVLAKEGNTLARTLVTLGEAVAAQMRGKPHAAIAALETIPPGTLRGEWAGQALMIRGTNLLLAGRTNEALAALFSSTGEGSAYTRSIAHDLLSAAEWYAGNALGALDEAEISERLAFSAMTTWIGLQRTAWRACLLAATGQIERAENLLERFSATSEVPRDEETAALIQITEAVIKCNRNDLEGAREQLEETVVPPRATRAATWKSSLSIALNGGTVQEVAEADVRGQLTTSAGRAGASHLAGGPLASVADRPYLPSIWCEDDLSMTRVKVMGAGEITRSGNLVDHRSWGRTRVRELFLHLAIVENATRALVAASLWPDLLDRDAGRNLRVTLTHLLDVLDPGRTRASGSALLIDTEGRLSLDRGCGLRVDVWDHDEYATSLLATPDHERETLLAFARRLASFDWAPLLGGLALGEWIEPHRRRRDELRISALLRGGNHAVAASDYRLAEKLALAALQVDPWSERAHYLLIESRIDVGDLDGARRAFSQAMATLNDLGVTPSFSVSTIIHRLGLNLSR